MTTRLLAGEATALAVQNWSGVGEPSVVRIKNTPTVAIPSGT
ncbi:hypothetical protein [Streptomyces decoyicus]